MWFLSLLSLLLFAVQNATAQAGFCQSSLSLCLVLSIPESQSGAITFNLTAPAQGWSAVGLGSSMEGALVFMVWPNPSGTGVVVSPRLANGEGQPTYYEKAGVEVDSSKSGISGGMMTAVFTCTNCYSWSGGTLQATNSKRAWIYAQNPSDTVTSTSLSANLFQHTARGITSVDMTKAIASSSSSSSTNNGMLEGTVPAITTDQNISTGLTKRNKVLIAHATLMSVAFLFMFPMGVVIIRFLGRVVPNAVWSHAGFQIFTWLLVVIGFGMGVWVSNLQFEHFTHSHQIFGAVIVFLFVLQIVLGLWHHAYFKSHHSRGVPSHLHMWFGRSLMLCGIINGGLGLALAPAPRNWTIAYAVIAAVVGISLIVGVGLKEWSRWRNGSGAGRKEEAREVESS